MSQLKILRSRIDAEITDPRRTAYGHVLHNFSSIIMIAFLAILSGVRSYVEMHNFARCRKAWLSKFINLDNGIPGSDTIRRCIERIDPTELASCFYGWLGIFDLQTRYIHLDGKTIRGSGNYLNKATHVLTAFCSDFGVTLAEMVVQTKDNEITGAKQLLMMMCLQGKLVTADAIMCQQVICYIIISKKGDYCLALKANQPTLLDDVKLMLDKGDDVQTDTVYEKGHGRTECREYRFTASIDGLDPEGNWPGLKAVGSVTRTYEAKGKETTETRYFILSVPDFDVFKHSTRAHWSVENGLHWSLDMIYDEDACTAKKDNAPINRNILRKTSLNLLNTGQKLINSKISRPALLKICNYTPEYLESLVNKEPIALFA